MKKSTKILGSVALSAALVMGTAAPAFANEDKTGQTKSEDLEVGTQTNIVNPKNEAGAVTDGSKGTGSTEVNISTYTSQISVTVPMSVEFALDTVGGPGYAPSAYKIINNTLVPVYVTEATIQENANGKYKFAANKFEESSATEKTEGAGIGDLYADFTPKPTVVDDAKTHLFLKKDATTQVLNWKIPAKPSSDSPSTYKYKGKEYAATETTALATARSEILGKLPTAGYAESYRTEVTNADTWAKLCAAYDKAVKDSILTGTDAQDLKVEAKAAAGTALGFDIAVSSSKLSNSEPKTDKAATIIYTVDVKAKAVAEPEGE